MFRVGLAGGWEERQRDELAVMLKGAMVSMCVLLELAAQAIEDAETERRRLEQSVELNTTKAERGSAFNGPTVDGRPLSWFLVLNTNEYESGNAVSFSSAGYRLLW